jgi:chemotaxis protein methyltransferase CheR
MNATSPVGRARGAEPAFLRLSRFLERRIGIVLGPEREYLAHHRLGPVLAAFGLRDLDSLVLALERQPASALLDAVIDAMTTHETLWFRDRYPFDVLTSRVLPERWLPGHHLRVWSAACSTGQEAYSLAITLEEYLQHQPRLRGATYDILGTDVSAAALAVADAGLYDAQNGVRGLSPAQLARYFERQRGGHALRPVWRRGVNFRRFNLLDDPAGLGSFDLIFLRNVLIYFQADAQQRLLERVAACLAPGATLVLGTAETLTTRHGVLAPRRLDGGVIYQRQS